MESEGNHQESAVPETNPEGERAPAHATPQPVVAPADENAPSSHEAAIHSDRTSTEETPSPPLRRVAPTRAVPPAEAPERSGRSWSPLWLVILLLLAVIGGLFAANRMQASKSTSSPAAPTLAPVPTAAPAATPVIKGGAVAAVVNGHQIPTSQYRTLLNYSYYARRAAGAPPVSGKVLARQAMNSVIVSELFRQYATSHHLLIPQSRINHQIAQIKAQRGGEKKFKVWLGTLGLNPAGFTQLLGTDLLDQKVAQKIAGAKPEPYANVRHILIGLSLPQRPKRTDAAAHALALSVFHQLQHGAKFAILAKKYSDDTQSGLQGGNLGQTFRGTTVVPFDHAIFTLPPHKLAMVRSKFGYHVLEVLSRGNAIPSQPSQQQQSVQQRRIQAWITVEKKKSSIKQLVSVQA